MKFLTRDIVENLPVGSVFMDCFPGVGWEPTFLNIKIDKKTYKVCEMVLLQANKFKTDRDVYDYTLNLSSSDTFLGAIDTNKTSILSAEVYNQFKMKIIDICEIINVVPIFLLQEIKMKSKHTLTMKVL